MTDDISTLYTTSFSSSQDIPLLAVFLDEGYSQIKGFDTGFYFEYKGCSK